MTSTTLSQVLSGVLDANGNTTITLRPDQGQNWAPLFVRVSTNSTVSPIAHCTVYHGLPGVTAQQSQYIDDTFLGSGDTSSMISGTPVRFGEAILFSFTGGTPGDTAIASVFGMQSNLPPNFDLLPQVPGTHFAGHPNTEVLTLIDSLAPTVFNPSGTFLGPVIDMRKYASYYLSVGATSVGAATDFNENTVTLFFYTDVSGAASAQIYQDSASFWADAPSGMPVSLGTLYGQDAIHAPYMRVGLVNNARTGDQLSIQYRLTGTNRQLPGPYWRQQNTSDGTLLSTSANIAASGSITLIAGYGFGRATFRVHNQGANPMTNISFNQHTPGSDVYFPTLAAGAVQLWDMSLSKNSGLLKVSGTVGDTLTARIEMLYN